MVASCRRSMGQQWQPWDLQDEAARSRMMKLLTSPLPPPALCCADSGSPSKGEKRALFWRQD